MFDGWPTPTRTGRPVMYSKAMLAAENSTPSPTLEDLERVSKLAPRRSKLAILQALSLGERSSKRSL